MNLEVYPGDEDSYFLIDCLKKEIGNQKVKRVLEIGTGSGIVSIAISGLAEKIVAVDINPKSIEFAQKEAKVQGANNIEFRISNLFEKVEGKFDLIFFNPPYLPGEGDLSCTGGKRGIELVEAFLEQVKNYLNEGGKAVILLSSFNHAENLKKKYHLEEIGEKKLFFEKLYCFRQVN